MPNATDLQPSSSVKTTNAGTSKCWGITDSSFLRELSPQPTQGNSQGTAQLSAYDLLHVDLDSTRGARVRYGLYKMRGKKADGTFLTWTTTFAPGTDSPTGEPLTEIVVSDEMILVSR